jgi:serine/threonine-protein kinase
VNRPWILSIALAAATSLALPERVLASDAATAEALFQEGRRLMTEARFAEACPKLAESYRIDPGLGVLLYLGDCYERAGKLASAWATFHEAIPPSRKAGQRDREEVARTRASALEPRLPKLVLNTPASVPKGYLVLRGEAEIAPATFGVAVPLDPGPHTLVVSAPGFETARIELVAEEGKLSTVNLPELRPVESPTSTPAGVSPTGATPPDAKPRAQGASKDAADTTSPWTSQHTAAVALAGGGLVGLGIGAGFGLKAMGDWSDAEARCTPAAVGVVCDQEGADLAGSADTAGWVSTIGFAAGGVMLATAAVLYFTADEAGTTETASVRVLPLGAPDHAGFVLIGSF